MPLFIVALLIIIFVPTLRFLVQNLQYIAHLPEIKNNTLSGYLCVKLETGLSPSSFKGSIYPLVSLSSLMSGIA